MMNPDAPGGDPDESIRQLRLATDLAFHPGRWTRRRADTFEMANAIRSASLELDISVIRQLSEGLSTILLPIARLGSSDRMPDVFSQSGERIPTLAPPAADMLALQMLTVLVAGAGGVSADDVKLVMETVAGDDHDPIAILRKSDNPSLAQMFDSRRVRWLVDVVKNGRFLVVVLPCPVSHSAHMIQYQTDSVVERNVSVLAEIGLQPIDVQLEMSSFNLYPAWSARLLGPEGVEFVDARIELIEPDPSGRELEVVPRGEGQCYVTAREVSCWGTGNGAAATMRLRATFYLSGRWIQWAALNAVSVAALLLVGASRIGFVVGVHGSSGDRGITATLLLSATGGSALILARPSEDYLPSTFLHGLRRVLGLLGAVASVAVATLAFGPSGDALRWTWWSLAAVSIALASPLVLAWTQSAARTRRLRRRRAYKGLRLFGRRGGR